MVNPIELPEKTLSHADLAVEPIDANFSLKDKIYDSLKQAITSMNIYADDAALRLDEPVCVPTTAMPISLAFLITMFTACSMAIASIERLAFIIAVVGVSFSIVGVCAFSFFGNPFPINLTMP